MSKSWRRTIGSMARKPHAIGRRVKFFTSAKKKPASSGAQVIQGLGPNYRPYPCLVGSGLDESGAQKGPGQQSCNHSQHREYAVGVQPNQQRQPPIPFDNHLHNIIPSVRACMPQHCGPIMAKPGHKPMPSQRDLSDQGQKKSLVRAKTISDNNNPRPTVIRTRNALSDGGWPVTASHA